MILFVEFSVIRNESMWYARVTVGKNRTLKCSCMNFFRIVNPSSLKMLYIIVIYKNFRLINFFFFIIFLADADSAEGESSQDLLTCGGCQKAFALADIVRFIQHKVLACNKENFSQCFPQGKLYRNINHIFFFTKLYLLYVNFKAPATDRDSDEGGRPLGVANARRPSISAPMGTRKGRVHTPPPASPALPAPHHLLEDGAASSTPKRLHEGKLFDFL